MDNQPNNGPLTQQGLPKPVTQVPVMPAPTSKVPKHFLAAFFLSFFLGVFGADRFYLGYYVSGALKLLTFGWFGIGALVDLGIIMGGGMRDSHGNALAGYDEYKSLAKKTVGWVSAGACVFIVATGVLTAIGIIQAINQFQSSGLQNVLGGGSGSSGTSQNSSVDSLLNQLQ